VVKTAGIRNFGKIARNLGYGFVVITPNVGMLGTQESSSALYQTETSPSSPYFLHLLKKWRIEILKISR
jgi:hypothetical protein